MVVIIFILMKMDLTLTKLLTKLKTKVKTGIILILNGDSAAIIILCPCLIHLIYVVSAIAAMLDAHNLAYSMKCGDTCETLVLCFA